MRPLVLMDVDGVLNAWPPPRDAERTQELVWGGFRVLVHEDTVKALRAVFRGAHEVVWCTAWRQAANRDPLKWLEAQKLWVGGPLDVITDGGDFGTFTTDWKLGAALRHEKVRKAKAESRRIVWFEDFGWSRKWEADIPQAAVTRAGITGVDTFNQGYLTPDHVPTWFPR